MRAVNHPQLLAIGINSELEIKFRKTKFIYCIRKDYNANPKYRYPFYRYRL